MRKLISWVEIPATDIERAAKFYGNVLNLEIQVMDFGKEKMACFPNGEGAISQAAVLFLYISLCLNGHSLVFRPWVSPLGGKACLARNAVLQGLWLSMPGQGKHFVH